MHKWFSELEDGILFGFLALLFFGGVIIGVIVSPDSKQEVHVKLSIPEKIIKIVKENEIETSCRLGGDYFKHCVGNIYIDIYDNTFRVTYGKTFNVSTAKLGLYSIFSLSCNVNSKLLCQPRCLGILHFILISLKVPLSILVTRHVSVLSNLGVTMSPSLNDIGLLLSTAQLTKLKHIKINIIFLIKTISNRVTTNSSDSGFIKITGSAFKSFKDKVCPMITYEEEE